MSKRNVRFWIWWNNDLQKITLRPGQVIELDTGAIPTEEGFSQEYLQLAYIEDEQVVARNYGSMGRDCDGGLAYHVTDQCPVQALAQGRENYEGLKDTNGNVICFPAWEEVNSCRRDEYAELAGY